MIIESAFKPAWWLVNPHAQTLYSPLIRRVQAPIDKVERLELPDGDFIDLAWAVNGLSSSAPLVVCLHGLGGSVNSTYVGGLLTSFNQRGWRGVLMHFRGASKEPNRMARAYHSGDTGDLDSFFQLLNQSEPHTKKAVVGISMGGNVLLKWLGEKGEQSYIDAAVAVSVPYQLRIAADRMNQGFSRIYQTHLLRNLRKLFLPKLKKEGFLPFSSNQINSVRCFWTFDDQVTAPLNGFTNVHEYYRVASSRQYLHKIMTPTLMIHSADDPFMTPSVIPTVEELSKDIVLELSQKGGHVGFIMGNVPGKPIYWLDQRIPEFLEQYFG